MPFTPGLLKIIGRKATMMIGGVLYIAFCLTFINPVPALVYTFAAIGGFGGSLLWIAQVGLYNINYIITGAKWFKRFFISKHYQFLDCFLNYCSNISSKYSREFYIYDIFHIEDILYDLSCSISIQDLFCLIF